MLTRLTVVLSEQERKALEAAASQEMRGMRDQARFFLRQALERSGLLRADTNLAEQPDVETSHADTSR